MTPPVSAPAELLRSLCVIVPARAPSSQVPGMVSALLAAGIGTVIVVDDGSGPAYEAVFEESQSAGAVLLRHAANLGKGRALKSAFNHVLLHHPEITGVVTADADGQHTTGDILQVATTLQQAAQPVLGSRAFAGDVPMRSRFGNTLTRLVFTAVTGTRLVDTQTGLRGLPRNVLPELLALEGERYEYEMNVLALLCRQGNRPLEVPIATVYIDGNRSSHFNPVWDSMRIYFVLVRFVLSSLVAAVVDFLLFTIAYAVTGNIPLSVAVGRASSLVNFSVNRRFVFRNRESFWHPLLEYYLLVVAVAVVSSAAIGFAAHRLHWNVIAAKVLVDSVLSLVSFSVQRTFVFRRSRRG